LEPRLALAQAFLASFDTDPVTGLHHARAAFAAGRDLGLRDVRVNALVFLLDHLLLNGELDELDSVLATGRPFAQRRPSPWVGLQLDLIEARALLRRGRSTAAVELLNAVAAHPLSENLVLRRDLAEARSWVALERGRWSEAHDLARHAIELDEAADERCSVLRPRLIHLVAGCAMRRQVPLGDVAALREGSRSTGLTTIAALASRWVLVDDLTHGWSVDLHGLQPSQVIEARALDAEIAALSTREWDGLLAAADVWSELGLTIWRARALLWHTELTGSEHPEVEEILAALDAPAGIAQDLRSQVSGLRD
jgi:hypothetical protein